MGLAARGVAPGPPPLHPHHHTLTNLYNQRPQWLIDAHAELEQAAAAYGWPEDISMEEALPSSSS